MAETDQPVPGTPQELVAEIMVVEQWITAGTQHRIGNPESAGSSPVGGTTNLILQSANSFGYADSDLCLSYTYSTVFAEHWNARSCVPRVSSRYTRFLMIIR